MAGNFPHQTFHDDYTPNIPQPTMPLTVAQIETLAKAGVKVELAHSVTVEPEKIDSRQFGSAEHLLDMVRDRWMMAMKAKNTNHHFGRFTEEYFVNPLLAAAKHGDKVYIFVAGANTPPHVIEDEAAIFPSDALLAKLHLMMEFGNGS